MKARKQRRRKPRPKRAAPVKTELRELARMVASVYWSGCSAPRIEPARHPAPR